MFYFEKKNMFGKFMPRTSADRPSGISADGRREEIRNVQEIPPHLEHLALGALERHFNASTQNKRVEILEDYGTYIHVPFPDYDAEPIETDADGFRIEGFLHFGAKMINDDGTVFAIKQDDLLRYISALTQTTDPAHVITELARQVHEDNVRAGWWTDLKTGEDLHGKRNMGEMLMLVVTELAEGYEGVRKGLMDDKLPHRPMLRVELIDAIIRMLDILGSQDNEEHPAGTIFQEKRAYNGQRADHKPENRKAAGGKAF